MHIALKSVSSNGKGIKKYGAENKITVMDGTPIRWKKNPGKVYKSFVIL